MTTPHISLIPKTTLMNARMNAEHVTTGGYKGSEMHTVTLPAIANNLKNALGSHLLNRRVLLSKSVNTNMASMAGANYMGAANDWEWTDAYLTLLSEPQVYGGTVLSSSFFDVGEATTLLPIFRFIDFVHYARANFWLRAVVYSTYFARADYYGGASNGSAGYSYGVRPLMIIG